MAKDQAQTSKGFLRATKPLLIYSILVSLFFVALYLLTHHRKPYLNLIIYLYSTLSLTSFILYGIDKWHSKKAAWRVPEKKLHLCNLLGGWPGALLAQQVFRHKTQKTSFRIVFWFTAGLNSLILILFLTPLGEKIWNLI